MCAVMVSNCRILGKPAASPFSTNPTNKSPTPRWERSPTNKCARSPRLRATSYIGKARIQRTSRQRETNNQDKQYQSKKCAKGYRPAYAGRQEQGCAGNLLFALALALRVVLSPTLESVRRRNKSPRSFWFVSCRFCNVFYFSFFCHQTQLNKEQPDNRRLAYPDGTNIEAGVHEVTRGQSGPRCSAQ